MLLANLEPDLRRYRYWTIQRSKHLLGYAADIGFYRRRKSMYRLHAKAEQILRERLGEERFEKLRVVRESRCLHIELNIDILWRVTCFSGDQIDNPPGEICVYRYRIR